MRSLLLLVLLLPCLLLSGQKKQVCFTFDDLPFVYYGITDTVTQKALMHKLAGSLTANNIPAIGFVNERKLYDDGALNSFQYSILKYWVESGLDLGNHTFSHPDYNDVSFENYTSDILKGESQTRRLLEARGKELRYFRHPFLHTGCTKEKEDSLNSFLSEHKYTVAPVTIDNEDYLFALAYRRAKMKNDETLVNKIGHDYIDYMERKLKYYEHESNALFGYNVKQILLVHASELNADYVDSLASMFRRNNYEFINLGEALKDKAYNTPVTVYGKWGISWLDRWALSMGKKGDFFKGEPESPDYIKKLAE